MAALLLIGGAHRASLRAGLMRTRRYATAKRAWRAHRGLIHRRPRHPPTQSGRRSVFARGLQQRHDERPLSVRPGFSANRLWRRRLAFRLPGARKRPPNEKAAASPPRFAPAREPSNRRRASAYSRAPTGDETVMAPIFAHDLRPLWGLRIATSPIRVDVAHGSEVPARCRVQRPQPCHLAVPQAAARHQVIVRDVRGRGNAFRRR
jgi:hypothetical protein